MKTIFLVCSALVLMYCPSKYTINLQEGVGDLTLGQTLSENPYESSEINIGLNDQEEIIFFEVKSQRFETPNHISIGDSLEEISHVYKQDIQKSEITKSNPSIGTLGTLVLVQNTSFIDTNGDGNCDVIIITPSS